jgi:hypothetical protein
MAFAENSVLTRRDREMKYQEDEGNCTLRNFVVLALH